MKFFPGRSLFESSDSVGAPTWPSAFKCTTWSAPSERTLPVLLSGPRHSNAPPAKVPSTIFANRNLGMVSCGHCIPDTPCLPKSEGDLETKQTEEYARGCLMLDLRWVGCFLVSLPKALFSHELLFIPKLHGGWHQKEAMPHAAYKKLRRC